MGSNKGIIKTSRNKNLVVLGLTLFLFWLGLSAQWTQLSALFLKRECIRLGIADTCSSSESKNDTVTTKFDFITITTSDDPVSTKGDSIGDDHHAIFEKAQKAAVERYKYFLLVQGIVNMIMCPLIGAISDSFGRKKAIIICLVCQTIAIIGVGVFKDFTLLLISQVVGGLGGGQYAITAVVFAAVADLTNDCPSSIRTKLFGFVEAVLWAGLIIGPFSGGVLVAHFGMLNSSGDAFILLTMAVPTVIAIGVVVLTLDESLVVREKFKWSRGNIFGAFYLLCSQRLSFVLSAMCFLCLLGQSGTITVLQLYTSLVFSWSPLQASLALTIMFASASVGVAGVLQILLARLHTKHVVLLSVSWAVGAYAALALVSQGWAFRVVLGCFLLNGIYFPVLRSAIASAFGEAKYGQALGAIATMQQLTQTAAPVAFSQIYESTIAMNVTVPHLIDDNFGPRMSIGIISSALNILGVCIALFLPKDLEAAAALCRQRQQQDLTVGINTNERHRLISGRSD